MDVFSLGRERDDKATSHRRLANQEHPVVVVVEEKERKNDFLDSGSHLILRKFLSFIWTYYH